MQHESQALLLALSIASIAGCTDVRSGRVGQEPCPLTREDYERTTRPPVSPVTLVDTQFEVASPAPTSMCCPGEVEEFVLDGIKELPPVSPNAARYPWGGHTIENGSLDTCNLCPYGIQYLQGIWGDTDNQQPFDINYDFSGAASRIEFDGNTFRWRYKHKSSGHWVDLRGYLYCPISGEGNVLVPLVVDRGDGAPCGLGPHVPPIALEPFPDIAVGATLRVSNGGWFDEGDVVLPGSALDAITIVPEFDFPNGVGRYFCRPSQTIGDIRPDLAFRTDCPAEETFFACWNNDPPGSPE